jgi:PTS system ascorbate-specific IIA component
MTIGILLVTHPGVGSSLLHTVTRILGACPLRTKCLEIPAGADVEPLLSQATEHLAALDDGSGVLVLSDIYGSTPSNIAWRLTETGRAAVLAGVNLPMLIRVYNYAEDDLDSLCQKAVEGGTRGIYARSRAEALQHREQGS